MVTLYGRGIVARAAEVAGVTRANLYQLLKKCSVSPEALQWATEEAKKAKERYPSPQAWVFELLSSPLGMDAWAGVALLSRRRSPGFRRLGWSLAIVVYAVWWEMNQGGKKDDHGDSGEDCPSCPGTEEVGGGGGGVEEAAH